MSKRVLLSGIGGSIGVHVMAHIFTNTNWEIVGLDSFRQKGYRVRIDDFLADHPEWKPRLTVIQTDLACPLSETDKDRIGPVNYILHLAAISDVQYSVENARYTVMNNVATTMTMLDYAKETPHEVFVYFSTDEVYGPTTGEGNPHKEWDVMRPSNPYAASKGAGELVAHAYWRAGEVKLIVTNTMNNFGETQSGSKFPVMIQKWLERGETVTIHGNEEEIGSRFYIHSRNTADALLFILQNTKPHEHQQGEIDEPDRYHIVGSERLNNLELARLIAELMGKELKYELVDFHKDNPAHDIHYGMEDNKLRAMGWKPPVDLRTSMKNTIAWQQAHKEWI
jgi:dTDP-glucose 4,6-dehydratase